MLMRLSWAKGVEICLQKPSRYLSAQCLFFVLFFQPAVNNFNDFWISPWYTNESSVLILPVTLCISSDAKCKQNSLLCNPEPCAPVGLALTGKERQPQPFLCHQPSGRVKAEACRKSRWKPDPWNLSLRHQLWHPRQGERAEGEL